MLRSYYYHLAYPYLLLVCLVWVPNVDAQTSNNTPPEERQLADQQQQRILEQQRKLAELEQQIAEQENINTELRDETIKLTNDIQTSEIYNLSLEQQLKSLDNTVQSNRIIIENQQKEIAAANEIRKNLIRQVSRSNTQLEKQRQQLTDTIDKLETSNQRLSNQTRLFNQQELLLAERQQELENITQSITIKEQQVSKLGQTINQQQQELLSQKNSIVELDKLVTTQKRALAYLWLLISVGLLFVITLVIGYRTKKRDNEKLSAHSQELQQARDKLEIEKQKAEAANNAKSQFLSLMSHELRTPMQAIIGYTDIMIEELKMDGDNRYLDDLERVSSNSERLLKIINNTLDLAKIEAGRMEITLSSISLKKLVSEAIDNVRPQIEKNENKLIVNIHDDDNNTPRADYEKLLHILINLLSNAAKFTHRGTINLTAKIDQQHLNFIIKDTGIGLTKAQQTTIFTRFYRGNNNNTNTDGTGLGLPITKQFCELMGGSITVKSTHGFGTSFIVSLPVTTKARKSSALVQAN